MKQRDHNQTIPVTIRWGLFLTLYMALPAISLIFLPPEWSIALLWGVTIITLPLLLLPPERGNIDPSPPFSIRSECRRILIRAALAALTGTVVMFFADKPSLFALPRQDLSKWGFLLMIYPWVSVLPQSIIYRTLFFRYMASLFPSGPYACVVSALIFGLAHIVFRDLWIVILCTAGGYFFSRTYQRTRSFALAAVEHTLYGYVLFSIGPITTLRFGTQWLLNA